MCDPHYSKTPPDNFGANLMQINKGKKFNGGNHGRNDGNHFKHKKNGDGKHRLNQRKNGFHRNRKDAWLHDPPPKDMKPVEYKGGYPVYKKVVKGKAFWWCAKCGSNCKWTTSHSAYQHDDKHKNNNQRKQTAGQANFGEGSVPNRSLWLAEIGNPHAAAQPWGTSQQPSPGSPKHDQRRGKKKGS